MAKLTYKWQLDKQEIEVEVEYDPKSDTVDRIIEAYAVNPHTHKRTAIGGVLCEWFGLDAIVDRVHWRSVYSVQVEGEENTEWMPRLDHSKIPKFITLAR